MWVLLEIAEGLRGLELVRALRVHRHVGVVGLRLLLGHYRWRRRRWRLLFARPSGGRVGAMVGGAMSVCESGQAG